MSLKKKIIIGLCIFWLVCGTFYAIIYSYRMPLVNKAYLKGFQKSSVLKEKIGEIVDVKIGFLNNYFIEMYDENKYITDFTFYTKDHKYHIKVVYDESNNVYGYIIDGELVYEKESLED